LKKEIKKTKHAIKKKMLPNIAQKFPWLERIKPKEDIINKIQPKISIFLLFINKIMIILSLKIRKHY
jgi:hypothetical protein